MRAGLVTCLLLLSTTIAAAQVRIVRHEDDRMTGVRDVDVLVSASADAQAGICPVDVSALQTAVVRTLTRAGIRATVSARARSWFHSVVVDIRTSATGDRCASAITTEVVAEVKAIPEADGAAPPGSWGSFLVGAMPLARENALVIRAPVEHDAAVQAIVDQQVVALAARIRAVNPHF